MDWEERGELDFERQLNLEKRRQDLQRQLALMDEEEAAREKDERKVKETKKEREEEHKPVVPVVHSKLHPEKSSVSPGDEFSPVSSQSTPKKKKKKTDGEQKKGKTKHKLSPPGKEPKKRKVVTSVVEGSEADIVDERTRKVSESLQEAAKLTIPRTQQGFEVGSEEKPRRIKKKQLKTKLKETQVLLSTGDAYATPSDDIGRRPQRTPPPEQIPREKRPYSPEEQRPPVEKIRRRAALSSPEGSDSPAQQRPREDRNRRITDSTEESPRKPVRDIHAAEPPGDASYKMKAKGYDKRYRVEEAPSTPEDGRRTVVKDPRHVEEGRAERRKNIVDEQPPRSPSPEDFPPRGPVTPPEEQRRHRTPPRGDRRGPQTPPGEPEFDIDAPKNATSERAPPRRRGPYTPPPPTTPPVRTRNEKSREEFFEGRPESVPYHDDMPRNKQRGEREARYPKPRSEEGGDELSRGGRGHPPVDEDFPRSRTRDEELGRGRHRDDRQEDYHQRGRPKDDEPTNFTECAIVNQNEVTITTEVGSKIPEAMSSHEEKLKVKMNIFGEGKSEMTSTYEGGIGRWTKVTSACDGETNAVTNINEAEFVKSSRTNCNDLAAGVFLDVNLKGEMIGTGKLPVGIETLGKYSLPSGTDGGQISHAKISLKSRL